MVKRLDAGGDILLSGETREEVDAALKELVGRGADVITPLSQVGKTWVAACTQPLQPKEVDRTSSLDLREIQAAQRKATGERADLEAGMAKYFATEAAQENALDCMRIHGGYGYSLEYRPERYYRDAPLLLIGEGSNEIQQLIIARRLLERP